MEQPFSTSKVTVEYSDPHGVYKFLAPGLVPRLPLRNLHWQSHAGPLRSIDTLHIELLPVGTANPNAHSVLTPDALPPNRGRTDSSARDASDGFQTQIGGGPASDVADGQAAAARRDHTPARRHQIPGLRRTPYLKVLLVRCDDNDSYKSTVRQEVRDWVKANTPASGAKKSTAENHDAFEWLILHVVLPNTAAATQPRTTGRSETTEKASAVAARWRTGSSTLMEKLRNDFNTTGKGAPDRIAQIRIGVNDVPYDQLPRVVPAMPTGYKETEEDTENAWADLVSKFRSLILMSFDARVTQYEEDIKEKDGQRTLPGWNFCTFFILKEGLARGFESVGLVEDALVGYDELSVGLDMVIKEQASGTLGATANAMLSYTKELKEIATRARSELYGGDDDGDEVVDMQAAEPATKHSNSHLDEIPISATKKPYRDLILENNVSVLDFRCYIFARQIALLLRLGNAWSTREELLAKLKEQQESVMHGVAPRAPPPKPVENEHENLIMLAEICRRTLEFIPSVSHVIRGDVQAALAADNAAADASTNPPQHDYALQEVIDNLVASFAFSVAQQVLAQTSSKALPIPPSSLGPPDGHEPESTMPEPRTMLHPARTSSLRVSSGAAGTGAGGRPLSSPNFFPGPGQMRPVSDSERLKQNMALKLGLEELASRRAELYTLSRNILEECGKKRGWSDGWDGVPVMSELSMVDMVNISLDEVAADGKTEDGAAEKGHISPESVVSLAGLHNKLIRTALDNSEDFYRLYETLTDKALRHYTVANHTHSVMSCLADLAVLKYQLGDYAASTSYFYKTTPHFGENGWCLLELSMLVMFSRCLKQLQRKDEYVKVMLKLLSQAASAERDKLRSRSSFRIGKKEGVEYPDSNAIKGCLGDLLAEAKDVSNPVRAPLVNFFSDVEVDGSPEYHDGRDSFSLHLKLTSLLVDEIEIEKAAVRMVGQVTGVRREIRLSLPDPGRIKPGRNRLTLESKVVIPGTYELDEIDLFAGNLGLHYATDANKPGGILLKTRPITIYHQTQALAVSLAPSNLTQLDRNNMADIELDSGWNDITSAEVRVKAATGGLRLLATEGQCVDPTYEFSKKPEGGVFSFSAIPPHSTRKIRFPYTTEHEVLAVLIGIEVTYTTKDGTFVFSKTPSIPIALDLGVNVQDVFKHDALFSRFTVSTASASPLRLLQSELLGSELFEAEFGMPPSNTVVVFPRQPATMLYKIRRKEGVRVTPKTRKTLYLKLDYAVVQDDIVDSVAESIVASLKASDLGMYGRLLADIVRPYVVQGLGPHELERATLLGYVDTRFVASSSAQLVQQLAGLGKTRNGEDVASTLSGFIGQWQTQNPRLTVHAKGSEKRRTIMIPVDVPSVAIVHTADIRLANDALAAPAVTVNQLLPATLRLKWTRIWDTTTPVHGMADMQFSYDVHASGEAWLLGGRRKGQFVIPAPTSDDEGMTSTAETEADIPLMLIPLREGWLPYPVVDVREVRPATHDRPSSLVEVGGTRGRADSLVNPRRDRADSLVDPRRDRADSLANQSDRGGDGGMLACETDFRNLGEAVRVVADRERVTLSLDASGPGGGPLVLEVARRGETRRAGRVIT